MSIRVDACIAQHIGDRAEQQDRVAMFPHPKRKDVLLAVVADGMGGHTGGAIAAEQVIHKAQQSFETFAPGHESAAELLRAIIHEAHFIIKLSRFTSESDPHSTAAVLLLQPNRVDWAYCGDSRIYHFRGPRLMAKSDDHSLVRQLIRQGRITEEEARAHPQRNLLITCLGDDKEPMIDSGAVEKTEANDAFVVCSDGVWGYFTDEEMGKVVAARAPREAAEALIEGARTRARGTGDNMSMVIVKLTREQAKEEQAANSAGTSQRGGVAAVPVFESARR
jgi:serine/threonine protein phosphatase PrpC